MTVFNEKYTLKLTVGVSQEENQQLSQLAEDVAYECPITP